MTVAPARKSVYRVLSLVAEQDAYGNVALATELEKTGLSGRDAGLALEIVYGTLTWKRLIDYWITELSSVKFDKLQWAVVVLLRMSLYQLRFLDRIPAHAVVSDAAELAKHHAPRAVGFINAILRSAVRQNAYMQPLLTPDFEGLSRAEAGLRLSFSDFLVDHFCRALGEQVAYQTMFALNQRVMRAVRVNQTRLSRDDLMQLLEAAGVEVTESPVSPYGIRIKAKMSITQLKPYLDGLFTIQGESSMLIAPLLGDVRGKRVLDACSAPGGKTTQIAELAQDLADITATDIHSHRVDLVKRQARRLGLKNIRVLSSDARDVEGVYDAVLLDAPCSGLGTIARKPDIKWAVNQERIAEVAGVQKDLLHHMAVKLQPGGVLLYSTCTISPLENERQVQDFLAAHPDFQVEAVPECINGLGHDIHGWIRILPQDFGGDGFFIARMRKAW